MFIGLTPIDRIRISWHCFQARREHERSLNANHRAAGTEVETYETESPVSDNSTAETDTPTVNSEIANDATASSNPGSNISADVTVEKPVEAAMSGAPNVTRPLPYGALDFSAFCPGMTINMNGPDVDPQSAGCHNPIAYRIPTIGFAPGMNPAFNPMLNMGANPAFKPIPTVPMHRVDNPKPVTPVKPPKAEPEAVSMEGMPEVVNKQDVQPHSKKVDARTFGVLQKTVPMSSSTDVKHESIFPNNALMYSEYPYLEAIERIALDKGYQIAFVKSANNCMIGCIVCDNSGSPIVGKGFTIDTGFIIDRRAKIFVGINSKFEGLNAYPLMITSGNNGDKKAPQVLNTELIANLIVAGNMYINGVKGMYTQDFIDLNTIVPLITIPTKNIDRATRKYIHGRLVELYRDNTLPNIAAQYPNSRFRIASFTRDPASKNHGTIILDSAGVPKHFGHPYIPAERVQIRITKDKCKVLLGDNIVEVDDD